MSFTLVESHSRDPYGLFYLALFLMFLAAVSILLERSYRFFSLEPEGLIEAAAQNRLERGLGPELQRSAMELAARTTRQDMAQGLRTLQTLAITTPLVGVLGTLAGLANAFRAIALVGDIGPGAVSAAMSEALIPAAVGIALGLVAFWSHAYLQGWLDRLTLRMSRHVTVSLLRRRTIPPRS